VKEVFAAALEAPVDRAVLLAGGASKEAWAVDSNGRQLLIRRAAGGVIHQATLSLEHEFEVLRAAYEAGVKVPEPIAYLGDVAGREAFVMERVRGETIGRRIVKSPPSGLDVQLAEELAKIHAIPPARVPFLESGDPVARFYEELDSVGEPHPAIELGLHWVKERLPAHRNPVVVHGDWRIGNIAVDEEGIVAVLDWEFAHLADPVEDLAWPLVRAWRFGADDKHLGGVGELDRYLARYAELTGLEVTREELLVWEVFGNVKWATGCLTQSRRHFNSQERSVELAVLGRLAAEMEYELLDLIDRSHPRPPAAPAGPSPAPPPARAPHGTQLSGSVLTALSPPAPHREEPAESASFVQHDRPTPQELAEAVREFLQEEILPILDDHRLKFRTLVAMNALAIARRELEASNTVLLGEEQAAALARRIRAGEPPDGALRLLKEDVAAKLRISNPAYLQKYE
jgi:aminoglycoside phosphotransferase (APT) family kinase protein